MNLESGWFTAAPLSWRLSGRGGACYRNLLSRCFYPSFLEPIDGGGPRPGKGRVAEWSKATDCKSVEVFLRRFESCLSHLFVPVARGLRILLIHSKNYCMHWYVPSISSIPLLQGITWDPTWKATPSKMKPDCRLKGSRRKKGVQSVFRAFPFEIHSWFQLAESRNKFRGRQQANWLGALWFPWTRSRTSLGLGEGSRQQALSHLHEQPPKEDFAPKQSLRTSTETIGLGAGAYQLRWAVSSSQKRLSPCSGFLILASADDKVCGVKSSLLGSEALSKPFDIRRGPQPTLGLTFSVRRDGALGILPGTAVKPSIALATTGLTAWES
ncbi:hypothetical protein VNO80_33871 [Phaseolus coccineus]|uniref:Uncharacterized protein n=1 Tax=Phaseolus coccineus TaxID=3886 RepID=A0AAN9KXS5_PHACN